MTRPVRVVHLTTTDMSLDWLLGPQLRAFREAGYEVIGMSAPGPHVPAIEAAGVRHVAVGALTRAPRLRDDVRAWWSLVRTLRAVRPDILHTHNPKPGVLGRVAGRLAGVPVIVNTQHGLYAQPSDRWQRRLPVYALERIASVFGDVELVQNPEDVATLVSTLHVPRRKVHLLGNGVDLTRFDPATVSAATREVVRTEWGVGPHEVLVGVVGRLVWEKGLRELLEAAQAVSRSGRPVRWVVIGPRDPDKPDSLDDAAIAQAADAGVVLTGERHDMVECYAAMDLFVTASWREGFPRSAMEASAMGLAVAATDIRGCRQVVDDGVTGLLFPVRDATALEAAVTRLVDDPGLRSAMGTAARDKAMREFDQQRVIGITLDTYAEMLARRSWRRRRRSGR